MARWSLPDPVKYLEIFPQLAKAFGSRVIVTVGGQDKADACLKLGADHAIDTLKTDLVDAVRAVADGVDVVVDTTGDPGAENLKRYLTLANQGAWLWVNCVEHGVPVREIKKKYLTVRSGRGRTHAAVERALQIIRSGKYPLEEMCTHTFGLDEVDLAIKATAGKGVEGAVHVIVDPWKAR